MMIMWIPDCSSHLELESRAGRLRGGGDHDDVVVLIEGWDEGTEAGGHAAEGVVGDHGGVGRAVPGEEVGEARGVEIGRGWGEETVRGV